MNKTSITFLFMLVLGLFLLTTGCTTTGFTQEQPEIVVPPQENTGMQQETYTSTETLVAFVDSAAAYVDTYGKEKALKEFNDQNGSFIEGELYIFAYDYNGTTLAHPVNPEKVGINRLNEKDAGTFIRETTESIKNGTGFNQINYINPTHNRTLESKLLYSVKIDDDWWLGSGIYTGPAYPSPEQ